MGMFTYLACIMLLQAVVIASPPVLPTTIEEGSDGRWLLKEGVTNAEVEKLRSSFMKFLELMWRNHVMPSHTDPWGWSRGNTLGRDAIDKFMAKTTGLVQENSRCLEWGIMYIGRINNCTEKWDFQYANPHHGIANMESKVIRADLDHPGQQLLTQFEDFFDAVFATQVFEHVSKPWLSAKHIFHILKPGGLLYFTVPFLARYHDVPGDNFRYTVSGAKRIFEQAGFLVRQSYVGGSSFLTSAYLLGYGMADIPSVDHEHILIQESAWRANRSKSVGNGRKLDSDLLFGSFILFQKPL